MDGTIASIIAAFDDCALSRALGMRVIAVENGAVTVAMESARTLGPTGVVHGGAIFSLADHAFGCAANLEGREVALSAEIQYLRPADGPLTATARHLSDAPAGSIYRVEVHQGDRLIALFSGHSFMIE